MQQRATCVRNQSYKIIDVTPEVIRDYLEESVDDTIDGIRPIDATSSSITPQLGIDLENAGDRPPMDIAPVHIHQTPPLSSHPDAELAHLDPSLDTADLFLSPQYSDPAFEDGIFLPGSQYQELHATLRSRIIDTARSTMPSRTGSPDFNHYVAESHSLAEDSIEDLESRSLAHLSPEHEFVLWQNYIDEVAGMYSLA
jgi:hypothetical protein